MRKIQVSVPCLDEEEWNALREPLETGWLTQGPKVAEFEQAFARYHGVKHAIATTSCTTALHLALLSLGVGPGDAVVMPSFTWIATANAVEYCGAHPVFCDINIDTYNIDPEKARQVIYGLLENKERVKAIIPVHLFGLYSDMDAIIQLANEFDLKIVEDAACAAGADYKTKTAGTMGNVGCYSFHPRKVLVTGEGGMCATNDDELAKKINCLRNHGASIPEEQRHKGSAPYILPDFNVLGYNYRMSDLQGAVGKVQLEKLGGFIRERNQWALYYDKELCKIPWLKIPARPEGCSISWQAYVCMVDSDKAPMSRNQLMQYLQNKGISTRPGTHAVHMQEYYRCKYSIKEESLPISKNVYLNSIALPLHNCMLPEDYEYVVETLNLINSEQ